MSFLADPFRAPYMQRALLELLILAVVTGPVSVFVLLRRRAFMADALTHTVFPGVAIAFFVHQSVLLGAIIAAIVSIGVFTIGVRSRRVDADAMLVVVIGGFFSVGVVVVSRGQAFATDLTALLFGKILAVDRAEIVATAIIALVVLTALALFAKEFVAVAFDELAAVSWGLPVRALDLGLNLLVGLVIVASLRAVGTVLVVALVIVPGAIARVVTDRIAPMVVVATVAAALASWAGLVVSYEVSIRYDVRLASGATIVLVLTAVFAIAATASALLRRRSHRQVVASEPEVVVA